jgi:lipoate-protein ligase A
MKNRMLNRRKGSPMKLYNWGKVPWYESQLIYHALASLDREGLSLVSPATPYVCIGFHQDVKQEVDLDYCKTNNIPVFRRDLGGGAVYLDGNQLFFQLILRKDNPAVPKRKERFYLKFTQPIVNVYNEIGIPAQFKPVNDIIAGSRKISGTGVGEIGNCIVFVGNLIMDFNYAMMARVLKVPDEKFRDKVHKTLRDNLSTIRRELGKADAKKWDENSLNNLMLKEFQALLGPMEPGERNLDLQTRMDELYIQMSSDEWLFRKGKKKVDGRDIKIRSGIKMLHRVHKAPGGLLRADVELIEDKFGVVSLSGDFFCFPEGAVGRLESYLEGQPVGAATDLLKEFFSDHKIETPGIAIDDWLQVLNISAIDGIHSG